MERSFSRSISPFPLHNACCRFRRSLARDLRPVKDARDRWGLAISRIPSMFVTTFARTGWSVLSLAPATITPRRFRAQMCRVCCVHAILKGKGTNRQKRQEVSYGGRRWAILPAPCLRKEFKIQGHTLCRNKSD
jgi:hypothetical protein